MQLPLPGGHWNTAEKKHKEHKHLEKGNEQVNAQEKHRRTQETKKGKSNDINNSSIDQEQKHCKQSTRNRQEQGGTLEVTRH